MASAPKPAPHLKVGYSVWESFSFTPVNASKQTVVIASPAQDNYLLSYFENSATSRRVLITLQAKDWKLHFYHPQPESTILVESRFLSLSQVPTYTKILEVLTVLGIFLSAVFIGNAAYHRRDYQKTMNIVLVGLSLFLLEMYIRHACMKKNALSNALRLITVVEQARQNNLGEAALEYRYLEYGIDA